MSVKLDSVLLFAFVIPFIMTVRISPGETPYYLFGIIFLGLLGYLVLDIFKLSTEVYTRLKQYLLWFIIILVLGSAFLSTIIMRHNTSPLYMIHDITLQQELALRFLLDGKNPYAATYFGTPLEQWHYSDTEVNPALYHFVMQPFYLLFALPFYVVSLSLFGFFDGRMPLLFLFFVLLVLADRLLKDFEQKRLFLVLLAFNPAILFYILEGRSDIFMYAFLFAGFYLLHIKRHTIAAIAIGLAFSVKQSAWPLFPLYVAYLYFHTNAGSRITQTVKKLFPFVGIFAVITVPFLLWDYNALLNSTVFYLSGSAQHSYPISGYGLGKLLNEVGQIKNLNAFYPFHLWQITIAGPVLFFLIKTLRRSPTVKNLILFYGIFLFVFWYFSRYFNNSHLAYLSVIFITAYFWPKQDKE